MRPLLSVCGSTLHLGKLWAYSITLLDPVSQSVYTTELARPTRPTSLTHYWTYFVCGSRDQRTRYPCRHRDVVVELGWSRQARSALSEPCPRGMRSTPARSGGNQKVAAEATPQLTSKSPSFEIPLSGFRTRDLGDEVAALDQLS